MRNIVCVKEGKRYGAEYVNILANSVFRNLPEGPQGRFVCFTDNAEGLAPEIEVRPLPKELSGLGWWNKLYLFKAGHFPDGDEIVYLDLDTVITGPLDEILKPREKFTILRDFYRGGPTYQSSFMAWPANHYSHIWEDWLIAGMPKCAGGDQEWIERKIEGAAIWQDLFPAAFVSFKVHAMNGIPKGARVVIFHGEPRPHQVTWGWMPEVWKIGGGTSLEMVVEGNTALSVIVENIRHALHPDFVKLTSEMPAHSGHAVIVGGGPSVNQFGPEIKLRQMDHQTIVALNNSWRWMERHSIFPDIQVMLDAREENKDFIPTAETEMELWYASQCHPAVLKAGDVAGKMTVWHSLIHDIVDNFNDKDMFWIGSGTTVGIRAIFLMYAQGYREFHLYGFDSSYAEGEGHAYKQPMNDGEKALDVMAHGRPFSAAPWMITQATEFMEVMEYMTHLGCVFSIHGDGLLPWMAKNGLIEGARKTAADLRAESILEYLADIEAPVGVEVGVFAGDLSKILLKQREDMTLYMVDSWEEHDKETAYAKTDFHGKLSNSQQEQYLEMTRRAVNFAGNRAHILRMRSIEAARYFADDLADIVFLDADHTYEAVRDDIKEWLRVVKPNGILCGHDYDHPDFPSWGVKKAVDEFCHANGYVLELGKNFTWFVKLNKQREKKYA